jgi:hypothetical protein
VPAAGDTFYLTQGTGQQPHLWVLLWGPAGADDGFLAVYLTTLRPHSDPTCVIARGDHPFVRHDTSVNYSGVRKITRSQLELALRKGVAFPREPVSLDLLQRIRAGFFDSPYTVRACVRMAREDFGAG